MEQKKRNKNAIGVSIKSETMLALALMYLNGDSARKMAKKVHMSEARIAAHLKSELFLAQVAEVKERMEKDHVQEVLRRIDQEGKPSLERLVELRDGKSKAEPKVQKIQLDAAKFIIGDLWRDRNMPKATPESGGIRLSISEKVLHEIFGVLQEYKNARGVKRVEAQRIPHAETVAAEIRADEAEVLAADG